MEIKIEIEHIGFLNPDYLIDELVEFFRTFHPDFDPEAEITYEE